MGNNRDKTNKGKPSAKIDFFFEAVINMHLKSQVDSAKYQYKQPPSCTVITETTC